MKMHLLKEHKDWKLLQALILLHRRQEMKTIAGQEERRGNQVRSGLASGDQIREMVEGDHGGCLSRPWVVSEETKRSRPAVGRQWAARRSPSPGTT